MSFGKKEEENKTKENYFSFSIKHRSYYSNSIHSIDLEIDDSKLYFNLEMRSIVDQCNKPYKFRGLTIDNKKIGFGIKVWEDNAYLKGYWYDNYLKGCVYFKDKESKIFMGKLLLI
jgi:hypothetical protein